MTGTMLDEQGSDYVVRWPYAIAERTGISVEYVAHAYERVTGQRLAQHIFYGSKRSGTPVEQIGALTPAQGKAIAAELQKIAAEIAARRATSCHYCGQKLRSGECEECGSQSVGQMLGLE